MKRFKGQHRRMIEIAETILDAPRRQKDAPDGTMNKLRLELSREISKHIAEEVALINQGAPARVDSGVSVMRRYHDELMKWRYSLTECNCAWPQQRAFAEPDAFARVFGPIVDALKARVRWEELHLYPALGIATVPDMPSRGAFMAR